MSTMVPMTYEILMNIIKVGQCFVFIAVLMGAAWIASVITKRGKNVR